MAELKPCPFCGKMPIIENCKDFGYFVKCKCGIEQSTLYAQRCDAVKRWNRRKTEQAEREGECIECHYEPKDKSQTECKMPYEDCEDCETHLKAQYGDCNKCRWYGDKQVCGRCRSRNLYAPKDESQTNYDKGLKLFADMLFDKEKSEQFLKKCEAIGIEPWTERKDK